MKHARKTIHSDPLPLSATSNPTEHDAQLHELIQRLYAGLHEEERSVAEANLVRYFETALTIVEDMECAEDGLTGVARVSSMKERSKVDLKT